MHVLMTGGTGLIGRSLSQSLIADGHSVTALTRNPDKRSNDISQQVRLVKWDAETTTGWADEIEQADAVVNLVGESLADGRWSASRKQRIRDSRVVSGQTLVKAIKQAAKRPQVMIQSSAVGYYGPCGSQEIDETSPPGRDFLAQVCFDWEAATAPVEKLGVRRAVARTGIVLSSDGGALPRIMLPYKFFAGGKIGSGQQWWPWIHIRDEVRAIRFLLESEDVAGPFNLTAPNPVTSKEFASIVGSVVSRPAAFPVPSIALTSLLGEMSTVLLDGQRAVPHRLLDSGFQFDFTTLQDALVDLLR